LAKVQIGESASRFKDIALWRFISLDKLIYLLENKSLYFSPLQNFAETDPFEGYFPSKAFKLESEVMKKQFDEIDFTIKQITAGKRILNPTLVSQFKSQVAESKLKIKKYHKLIAKSICVNCWHINEHESEAMWRIYSESNKGIAIQTNLDSLSLSLISEGQDELIQIGAVKYLDFFDESLSPKDFVVDGHLAPLLKRKSYEHEKELRLFIIPMVTFEEIDSFKPKPISVSINSFNFINKIIVSPYSKDSYFSIVCSLCRKYGIDPTIVLKSSLLTGHDDLINILDNL
jgi:hypothetical protein